MRNCIESKKICARERERTKKKTKTFTKREGLSAGKLFPANCIVKKNLYPVTQCTLTENLKTTKTNS